MSGGLPRAFLDAIVADIDDDAPRLIYADWLDEQGDADRAELIRVQCRRARLPAWDAAQLRLRLREEELLKEHGEQWLAEMPAVKGARWEGFRRGVVAEVSFTSFEAMRAGAHACRAVAPVEAVTVRWPRRREGQGAVKPIAELRELSLTGRPAREGEVGWLADSPQLATLRALTARGLWLDALRRLTASPHLSGLKAFRLPSNNLGNTGIRVLTEESLLISLEELTLTGRMYERYGDDPTVQSAGLEALAAWPGLARVRALTVIGSDARRAGVHALLRSPHAEALKELSLRGGRFDGQTMAEFYSAPPGLRLETLDLGENVLKDVGAEYLAIAPCLRELKALWLDRCEITQVGAGLFAKKTSFLGGLRILEVGHNHFGSAGLAALLGRSPPSLHTLGMRDNDLFDRGAEILAASPASDVLCDVDLGQNQLGPSGARALGESPHLRGLLVLRLGDNPLINESAAKELAASPLGRRLAVLEVDSSRGSVV
ncbi:MAG TPA: TIGR02996 domain-containing protein [Gemmataceae bacterium]|nr:TIGR02996 domain-containing protein [Gemmataceae bacterium]